MLVSYIIEVNTKLFDVNKTRYKSIWYYWLNDKNYAYNFFPIVWKVHILNRMIVHVECLILSIVIKFKNWRKKWNKIISIKKNLFSITTWKSLFDRVTVNLTSTKTCHTTTNTRLLNFISCQNEKQRLSYIDTKKIGYIPSEMRQSI